MPNPIPLTSAMPLTPPWMLWTAAAAPPMYPASWTMPLPLLPLLPHEMLGFPPPVPIQRLPYRPREKKPIRITAPPTAPTV